MYSFNIKLSLKFRENAKSTSFDPITASKYVTLLNAVLIDWDFHLAKSHPPWWILVTGNKCAINGPTTSNNMWISDSVLVNKI